LASEETKATKNTKNYLDFNSSMTDHLHFQSDQASLAGLGLNAKIQFHHDHRSLADDSNDGAQLLVWVPIVTLLSVICFFFLIVAARLALRRYHEKHPSSESKIASVTDDEEMGPEEKHETDGDLTLKTEASVTFRDRDVMHEKVVRKLPAGLVNLMIQQQLQPGNAKVPQEYKHIVDHWVRKYSDTTRTSDIEALEMFCMLSGLLDTPSVIAAASSLRDRGFTSTALKVLACNDSDEVQQLREELDTGKQGEYSGSNGTLLIHYGKFWHGKETRDAVASCYRSLKEIMRETTQSPLDPNRTSAINLSGGFSEEEQTKFAVLKEEADAGRIEAHSALSDMFHSCTSPSCDRRHNDEIFRFPLIKLPLVRFIKVDAILGMKSLTKHEDIPKDAFSKEGRFAVSFSWMSEDDPDPSGAVLERLKHILTSLPDVKPNDGVYIDWCCFHLGDPLRLLVTKSIFQHCQVIFLPSPHYFSHSWCTYEYFTWLLSPFPNQAICDYDLDPVASRLSLGFGRPPFLLDRPELGCFGYRCMANTQAFRPDEKSVLMKKILRDSPVYECSLEELLTKIVFKLETAVLV
jgi:hypothetical protein